MSKKSPELSTKSSTKETGHGHIIVGAVAVASVLTVPTMVVGSVIGSVYEQSRASDEAHNRIISEVAEHGVQVPPLTGDYVLDDDKVVRYSQSVVVPEVKVSQEDLSMLNNLIMYRDKTGATYIDLSKTSEDRLSGTDVNTNTEIGSNGEVKYVVTVEAPNIADTEEDLSSHSIGVALVGGNYAPGSVTVFMQVDPKASSLVFKFNENPQTGKLLITATNIS